jgi:hypothetical protein
MASVQTETTGEGLAAGAGEAVATVSAPDFIISPPASQEEFGYLHVAFSHGCAVMDDIELGLTDDLLRADLKSFERVRTAHLTREEIQTLAVLLGQEAQHRPAGVRGKIVDVLQLPTEFDELTELAAAVGIVNLDKTHWTADELLVVEFPEPNWAIPGILTEGLAILAGRPKLGKSWLALQWARSVGTGGTVFDRKVKRGKVLYLALEDNARRIQRRQKAQGWEPGADVVFETAWPDMLDGGLQELTLRLETQQLSLVVIDTLSRAMYFDQNEVHRATSVLSPLQQLALKHNCCILLIDHHKKSAFSVDDVIDEVLGSTGKTGVADVILGLFRERGKTSAVLKVTGRDIEDLELVIEWHRTTCAWQLLGDARNTPRTNVERLIMAAIKELGGEATTKEIATYLEKDTGHVSRVIGDLLERHILIRGIRSGRDVPYQINPLK